MTGSAAAETVLAFDYGEKRVGVAVGNSFLRTASALETIAVTSRAALFAKIAALIGEWQPRRLVVGIPYAENSGEDRGGSDLAGSDSTLSPAAQRRCQRFADRLQGRFGLPVECVDERYTSLEADAARRRLRSIGLSRRAGSNDQLAAQCILQRYFDEGPERPIRGATSATVIGTGNHAG